MSPVRSNLSMYSPLGYVAYTLGVSIHVLKFRFLKRRKVGVSVSRVCSDTRLSTVGQEACVDHSSVTRPMNVHSFILIHSSSLKSPLSCIHARTLTKIQKTYTHTHTQKRTHTYTDTSNRKRSLASQLYTLRIQVLLLKVINQLTHCVSHSNR